MAGGIPVLRALQEGLAGDRLVEVRGILNGTCAYILSRMQSETISFADALAEAQKAGYAEADPSEDLDGADAAAKLAIIAAVGLRRPVRVDRHRDASRSGRSSRSTSSTRASSAARSARSRARRPRTTARCSPPSGPRSCRCRRASAASRAARTSSPSAASSAARRRSSDPAPADRRRPWRSCPTCCRWPRAATRRPPTRRRPTFHQVSGDFVAPHYVRFTVNDKPGILAQVTTAYAKYGINIEGVLQLPKFRKDRLPFVTTLEECSGVGARSRAGRGRQERLSRPAAAGAADLRADMANAARVQRGRRGRRPPDRLADPQRRLRHGRQAQRVVRRPEVRHRPEQRRAVVDLDADLRADRAGARRRCSRSWSRSAAGSPISTTRCCEPADRDGCVPDDFYSTTNHRTLVRHRRPVARGRAAADGRGHRRSKSGTRVVPQAARRHGRATPSSAASPASASCRSSRNATVTASRS